VNRRIGLPALVAAIALLAALTVASQLRAGAYGGDLGADEASHYASGLMIHDYLRHGLGTSPEHFLIAWHSHYPLIGIGHWGPLYYVVEAAWMLLAGTTVGSALALSAVIVVATGMIVFVLAAKWVGVLTGMLTAAAFVISPIVQTESATVMLDVPIALLCLLAALAYAMWMRTLSWKPAVAFSLLAAAAMLVKGNAGCLALVPPLAVLISRRWDLLRRWTFWCPVPITGVLVVPWYLLTYGLVEAGFRYGFGWTYIRDALRANFVFLLQGAGPGLLIAAVLGLLALFRGGPRRDPALVVLGALLVAVCLFQTLVPAAIQARYLAPALPPLLVLAAWLVGGLLARPFWRGAVVGLLVLTLLPAALPAQPKLRYGMVAAARAVWAAQPAAGPEVLIAADGAAEGAAVAALAADDPKRPSLFAIRGSRLLGGGGYNRADYLPRYATPRDAMAAIDAYRIPLVLLRTCDKGNEWAHVNQVREDVRLFPERWSVLWHTDLGGCQVYLYRVNGNTPDAGDIDHLRRLTAPQHLTRR
jgi:hypothetical protein